MSAVPSAAAAAPLVAAEKVCHWYGRGALRRQVLFDVDLELAAGEIMILTGPSGSGKTTLLTLLGALRSTQEGRLRVLGRELRGARPSELVSLRRQIGYIFQHHNLVGALGAWQNVALAAALSGASPARCRSLALETLEAVGLGEHAHKRPGELSGGQRQRVAVARALAASPRLVLADEPTASLDRQSGKEVVDLLRRLVREHDAGALIVTHDNRILDAADRIVHMEDGRRHSFTNACAADTQRMLDALARTAGRGELGERVREMDLPQFAGLLEELTSEFQRLLGVLQVSRDGAFESMLDKVLEAFTLKIGALLQADRATLFVVDAARSQLWSKVAAREREIRVGLHEGIAGHVATTGRPVNVPDAYQDPRFNRTVDVATGYRTRSLLCMPIFDAAGRVFAVMELLNKLDGRPFDADDEERFRRFTERLAVILEAWTTLRQGAAPPVTGA